LIAGKAFGWIWMDASMGIVGGSVISRWAQGLLKDTSLILPDGTAGEEISHKIKGLIESDADNRVADLHVWKINARDSAVIISIVTHYPQGVKHCRSLLADLEELKHISIEIHACEEEACLPGKPAMVKN